MKVIHHYQMLTILLFHALPLKVYSCPVYCQCFDYHSEDGIQLNIDCKSIIELKDQLIGFDHKQKMIDLVLGSTKRIHDGSLESFRNVTYLSIIAENLEYLDDGVFDQMIHLKDLFIEYTSIQFLNLETFASLQSLTHLTIVHNLRLELNGSSPFPYLPKLHSLDLSGNTQLHINESLFENLSNLKVLRIDQISINKLNKGLLFRLKKLEELSVTLNEIIHIDETSFQYLHNLKKLDLSYNHLQTIHQNLLSNLTHLQSIRLSHNQITAFPKRLISNCTRLEDLDISYNMMKSIDHDLFHRATFLRNVQINSNQLSFIHSALFLYSRNLEVIDFSQNSIKSIPKELFQDLKLLIILRLAGNQITFLHPSTFLGLINLKFLALKNNKLSFENFDIKYRDNTYLEINDNQDDENENKSEKIFNKMNVTFTNDSSNAFQNVSRCIENTGVITEAGALFDLPDLKYLVLSGNNISFLPKDIFCGLKNLTMLDLNDNKIKSVDNQLLPLRKLGSFLIHNNDITSLSSTMFANLKYLGVINLKNNKINFIHHKAFSTLNLNFLYLSGNDLQCSCYILTIVKNICLRLEFDCILQGSRIDVSQLSCDVLTSDWQRLLLSNKINDTDSEADVSILNPGNEFMVMFNLKRSKDENSHEVFLNLTSNLKNSSSLYNYIHITETNGLLLVSINQTVTSQKYISPPGSNQYLIKVIYENDSLNARMSVVVNEKVVDSVINHDGRNLSDMEIKMTNSDEFCNLKAFSSRCAYSNDSCAPRDLNNDDNEFCSDFMKVQKSNDIVMFLGCIYSCLIILIFN